MPKYDLKEDKQVAGCPESVSICFIKASEKLKQEDFRILDLIL
jgi:hypothetical protein